MKTTLLLLVLTLLPSFCFSQETRRVQEYKGSFRLKQTIINQKQISQKDSPIHIIRKGNTLKVSGVTLFEFASVADSVGGPKNDSVGAATNGWLVNLGKDTCIFSSPGLDTIFKWTQPMNMDIQPGVVIKGYQSQMEQKSERPYLGDLLIVEIPPGSRDNMPVYKPDSSVRYFLKIIGPNRGKK